MNSKSEVIYKTKISIDEDANDSTKEIFFECKYSLLVVIVDIRTISQK